MLMIKNPEPISGESALPAVIQNETGDQQRDGERLELIALFRLLMREPPADHDFRTCPICKRYGITRI